MPCSRPKQRGIVANAQANFARGAKAPPQRLVDFVNQLAFTHALGKALKGAQVPSASRFALQLNRPAL